jgi:hypothetical protein
LVRHAPGRLVRKKLNLIATFATRCDALDTPTIL